MKEKLGRASALGGILDSLTNRSPNLSSLGGFFKSGNDTPKRSETRMPSETFTSEILNTMAIDEIPSLKKIDFTGYLINTNQLSIFLNDSYAREHLKEVTATARFVFSYDTWKYQTAIQCAEQRRKDKTLQKSTSASGGHDQSGQSQAGPSKSKRRPKSPVHLEKFRLNSRGTFIDLRLIYAIDLSSLTTLVLADTQIPSDYLLSLIGSCLQLQEFHFCFLSHCECRSSPCVHLESAQRVLELLSTMENLNSLKIDCIVNDSSRRECSGFTKYLMINDNLISLIRQLGHRGRLTEFALLDEWICTEKVILAIADHLRFLKSLEFYADHCIKSIMQVAKKMINLEKLMIRSMAGAIGSDGEGGIAVGDADLKAIASNLVDLKCFHVCQSESMSFFPILSQLHNLEELRIAVAHLDLYPTDPKFEDWTIDFGSQMKALELPYSRWVYQCLEGTLNKMRNLRRLDLEGSDVDTDSLRIIDRYCRKLRELDLSFCAAFLDRETTPPILRGIVQQIIDNCPELNRLLLQGAPFKIEDLKIPKYRVISFE